MSSDDGAEQEQQMSRAEVIELMETLAARAPLGPPVTYVLNPEEHGFDPSPDLEDLPDGLLSFCSGVILVEATSPVQVWAEMARRCKGYCDFIAETLDRHEQYGHVPAQITTYDDLTSAIDCCGPDYSHAVIPVVGRVSLLPPGAKSAAKR